MSGRRGRKGKPDCFLGIEVGDIGVVDAGGAVVRAPVGSADAATCGHGAEVFGIAGFVGGFLHDFGGETDAEIAFALFGGEVGSVHEDVVGGVGL